MFHWRLFSLKLVIYQHVNLLKEKLRLYNFLTYFLELHFKCSSVSQNNLSCQYFMYRIIFKGQNSNQVMLSFARAPTFKIFFQNRNWYSFPNAVTSYMGTQRHIILKSVSVHLSCLSQINNLMNNECCQLQSLYKWPL